MKKLFLTLFFCLFMQIGFCATYVNDGSINWNGNWQKTSKVDALHASTNLNVDNGVTQYSGYWTGNASNTDLGCLAYITSLTTPATARTITVTLESATDTVFTTPTAEQTATYITASATKTLTWIYFKLGTAELEDGATPLYYRYKFVTDNAADTGFRADNAATTKVAIVQILSATGTLVAADVTYVVGAGTQTNGNPNAATVTYNVETGAATGGDNGYGVGNLFIANGGTLAFANVATKSYYLEIAGNIQLYNNGTLNIAGGTAVSSSLEFNCASANQYNLAQNTGGILTMQGASLTYPQDTLGAAISIGNQSFTTTNSTGWAIGNKILVPKTTINNVDENEVVTITGISGTTIYIDSNGNGTGGTPNFTYAHGNGMNIANLTRNVKVFAGNTIYDIGYFYINEITTQANVNVDNVEFSDFRGFHQDSNLEIGYQLDYCTLQNSGTFNYWAANSSTVSFSYLAGKITNEYLGGSALITLSHCLFAGSGNSTNIIQGGTYTSIDSCVFAGSQNTYGVRGIGVYSMTNCKIIGMSVLGGYGFGADSSKLFYVSNCSFDACTVAIRPLIGRFYNCSFGDITENTVDVVITNTYTDIKFYNCSFSPTVTSTNSALYFYSMTSHDHDATQYRYKTWNCYGTLTDNTTTAITAQGGSGTCLVMNPSSSTAGNTLNGEIYIPVTAATDPQLKFYIYRSLGTATLNLDVYDSDDDNTLLVNNASLTATFVNGAWAQYTVTFAANPTDTGYCRCVLKALDDGLSRNIAVDTFTIVSGGNTLTDNLENWKDALPQLWMQGGGGTTYYQSGSFFNGGLEQ